MMKNEVRTSIKTVYGMLWDVLALYEKTDGFNTVPEGEKAVDILEFLGDKLLDVRKTIDTLFLGEEEMKKKLTQIADETEFFVRGCEIPGVVTRWKKINPQIVFFDCAFELLEECPEEYRKIRWGLTDLKLKCYPDETLIEARRKYFEVSKKKMEEKNLQYTEDRVFQDELLRTLTLVFEYDFADVL